MCTWPRATPPEHRGSMPPAGPGERHGRKHIARLMRVAGLVGAYHRACRPLDRDPAALEMCEVRIAEGQPHAEVAGEVGIYVS